MQADPSREAIDVSVVGDQDHPLGIVRPVQNLCSASRPARAADAPSATGGSDSAGWYRGDGGWRIANKVYHRRS